MKTLALLALGVSLCFGQLTMDQKITDFQYMAGVYAKRYAPYEWKRDAIGFDLLNIAPWLDKIRATKDDLGFYDVASEYVASLNDAHDVYTLPSTFSTQLNFSVDLYDGKLLVESINRTRLPAAEFGFAAGYELVSIDGVDALKQLEGLRRYEIAANERSTRRFAALLLTTRPQSLIPYAANVPEVSTVVFRRPDGNLETYRIPWTRTGLPLTSVGRFTSPQEAKPALDAAQADGDIAPPDPDYTQPLRRLQNWRIPDKEVIGFNATAPVFAASLPSSFVQRLGRTFLDAFYSGVFESGGLKIGYIRIPTFSPLSASDAVTSFQKEIAYFQANTDGLVIDVMRNGGGSGSYTNQLLSFVMPAKWHSMTFEVRATSLWVADFSSALESAKAQGAPQDLIDLLESLKAELVAANHQPRGKTHPIAVDGLTIDRDPATDLKGNVLAYTKPVMLLVDEMSASAAEVFAATIQDNGRGPLFGWRTMGAGGSVEDWEAGSYSQGLTSVTESLMHRKDAIQTSDYPAAPYVENIGVRPEITADYMTAENLTKSGKPFVDAFVAAMVDHIRSAR